MTSIDEIVAVELTGEECEFLLAGLRIWHGAATPSTDQLHAFGFLDVQALRSECFRFEDSIAGLTALSRREWTQLLFLTEIAFVSDVQGAGFEWRIITGMYNEGQCIAILRGLQKKLIKVRVDPRVHPLSG